MVDRKAKAFQLFEKGATHRQVQDACRCAKSTSQDWKAEWKRSKEDAKDQVAEMMRTPDLTIHKGGTALTQAGTLAGNAVKTICEAVDGALAVQGVPALLAMIDQRDKHGNPVDQPDQHVQLRAIEAMTKLRVSYDGLMQKQDERSAEIRRLVFERAERDEHKPMGANRTG